MKVDFVLKCPSCSDQLRFEFNVNRLTFDEASAAIELTGANTYVTHVCA